MRVLTDCGINYCSDLSCILPPTRPSLVVKMETIQTSHPIHEDKIRQQVRERYGAIAKAEEKDCGCGPSCCTPGASPTVPEKLGYSAADSLAVPEGAEMGLGCGNPLAIASIRPGETVVDLGSGGGFDCFLAARQTGPKGSVIGVDMTPEMISKARANAAKADTSHVEFRLGEIENLPVANEAADLVISNCVVNLSPNKRRVLREIFRVLKPGGRVAISDIVATAPIPEELRNDFIAYTGCVAGASNVADMEQWLTELGFVDVDIQIKEASRKLIDEWVPGKSAGRYVASANIKATKPKA
jgi:arsenite methyltransferase